MFYRSVQWEPQRIELWKHTESFKMHIACIFPIFNVTNGHVYKNNELIDIQLEMFALRHHSNPRKLVYSFNKLRGILNTDDILIFKKHRGGHADKPVHAGRLAYAEIL